MLRQKAEAKIFSWYPALEPDLTKVNIANIRDKYRSITGQERKDQVIAAEIQREIRDRKAAAVENLLNLDRYHWHESTLNDTV